MVQSPSDRLSIALKKMESRHAQALLKWDARREDLVEKRKLHLLQVELSISFSFLSHFSYYYYFFNVDLGDEGFFYYHGEQSSTLRANYFYE